MRPTVRFRLINTKIRLGDAWFMEYWEEIFHCSFREESASTRRCSGNESYSGVNGKLTSLKIYRKGYFKIWIVIEL